MDITITIQNPTEDAIRALAVAVGNYSPVKNTSTPVAPEAEQTVRDDAAPTQDKPKRQRNKPEPQPEPETQQADEPDSALEKAPEPQVNVPTVVELRAKAQEVGTTPEGKKAIKALLDKFGAQSISSIPEEKRAEFLAELDLV